MEVQQEKEKQIPRKIYKDDIHNSIEPYINFAILTIGKKYKNVKEASDYQVHMYRKVELANVDASKTYLNQNLRGNGDEVVKTLEHYLSDCIPWKKNQTIARQILVTASKRFFQDMPEEKLQLWVNENIKFLESEFGDNLLFAVCHRDEGAEVPHIHVLVATKFYDHLKQEWKVQAYRYFNGRQKLQELQDRYAEHMQKSFPELQRGCKYTRAEYYNVKKFYGMLENDNINLSEEDAKVKLQLQDIKFKRLESTLKNYKMVNADLLIENSELRDENKELKEESTIMAKAIKDLMIRRHIPQQDLDLSLAKVQTQNQSRKVGS